MSRAMQAGSKIRGAGGLTGAEPYTQFGWVYMDDFASGSAHVFMRSDNAGGYYRQTGTRNVTDFLGETSGLVDQVINVGDATHNGEWIPFMFTHSATERKLYLKGYPASITTNTQANKAFWGFEHGSTDNTRAFSIAECCNWDMELSQADFDQLVDMTSGSAINPSLVQSANIMSYTSYRTDFVGEEVGNGATYTETGTTIFDANHPPVDALTQNGPSYIGPDTISNRTGDVINLDASSWFETTAGTIRDYTLTGAPAGVSIDPVTGAISGTVTTAEDVTATVGATDDNGTTTAAIAWAVTGWSLVFDASEPLEDSAGAPLNTNAAQITVFLQNPGDGLLVQPQDFPNMTVTAGALTLLPLNAGPGKYSICMKVDGLAPALPTVMIDKDAV